MSVLTLSVIRAALDIKDHCYGRKTKASVQVGTWEVSTTQSVDEDRNCYSKSWHRKYGAKYTISSREITFKRKCGKGFVTKRVDLSSWAGNYLENAIVSAGIEPKAPKAPLSVRLHKAFDAVLVRELRGHKIYQRTLLGQPVDFVIVAPMGTTYHDDNRKNLMRGLYSKIKAMRGKVDFGDNCVDWDACRKLGFCKEGIKAFCNDFGFDVKKQYSPREIAEQVKSAPHLAVPYLAELRTLAAAYNYQINF
jgi:hypothetical protein